MEDIGRRRFLVGTVTLLAAARLGRAADAPPADAASAPRTPKAALERLMEGNARYVAGKTTPRDFSADRGRLVAGQAPFAALLACSDSRVVPEFAFDAGRGDLFVVRVAGNFVEDDGLASLEYAVAALGVPLVVVLGHEGCGAVKAAIADDHDAEPLPGKLPMLVGALTPAVRLARKQPGDLLKNAIRENVRLQVAYLRANDPVLAPRVAAGRVLVVGGVYDLESGRVTMLGVT
jgi:carbonic anhydrase